MNISDTPEEDFVPDIPTASLSADILYRTPIATVADQMQPILYTIYETSADFDEEEASMAKTDIIESIEKDPEFKTKAELVSEQSLKTMVIMDFLEPHDIKAKLTVDYNKIGAETESETSELTKQIDIEAELSNMKNEINYVEMVANIGIVGNDEQPDIDIGLGIVPEYSKYYQPDV